MDNRANEGTESREVSYRQFESHSLRHIILKYKVDFCFSMVDPRIASGQDRVWKASVWSVLKFGREPSLTAHRLCFCILHTNEIPRTDPLVQVDYARVVDLDIRASKSDICAVRVVTISERVGRNSSNRGLV